jgi:hypothetical protein
VARLMAAWGQKAKYSLRAHVVCFAPESGLKTDIAGGPLRATSGLMHRGKQHLLGASPHPGRAFALDVLVEDTVLYFGK